MPQQVYVCKHCGFFDEDLDKVMKCENGHPKVEDSSIIKFRYENKRLDYVVPSIVVIRFSNKYGDLATYKLDYVGMKGV